MDTKTIIALLVTSIAFTNSLAAQTQSNTTPVKLTLGEAVRYAAEHSASAQLAQYRANEADARVRQRRGELLPSLSGVAQQGARTFNTASFGIEFPTAPGNPPLFDPNGEVLGPVRNYDYRLRIQQNIFDAAAIGRLRSARATARANDADATVAAELAASNAALQYIRAFRAQTDLNARSVDSVLAADLVRIAQEQLSAGTGIILDVTRAQAQLASTKAQLIAARNLRERTRLDLLRALGMPLTTEVELVDSLGVRIGGEIPNAETVLQTAVTTRAELKAENERVTAARRSVSALRAERLPAVSVVADRGVNGKSNEYLLNTYTWAVQMSLPLFDGFRREGRIQEQQAMLHEAELRQKDVRDQVTAEAVSALLDLTSTSQQVEAARERLTLAEQEVAQARERFSAGVAGNAEVVTALLSLTNSRTAFNDAIANYLAARVGLSRAQGTLTTLP